MDNNSGNFKRRIEDLKKKHFSTVKLTTSKRFYNRNIIINNLFENMFGLVNSTFNRTYNPCSRQNVLSDIKRLLTSRDTNAQNKACNYLIDFIKRFNKNSNEGARMIEYLLESDIAVFLCEATSNLDFALFRSILACLRLLCSERRFFAEEHAAHAMSAVLRALARFAGIGSWVPIQTCLHFLCDLLNGVTKHKTTSPLSHQSAYSAIQLLACLNSLTQHVNTSHNITLATALVLHALINYQPDNLDLHLDTAKALTEILTKWFGLLVEALNHSILLDEENSGMFFVVISQMGMDVLRLIKVLNSEQKIDFVHAILTNNHETNELKHCAEQMGNTVKNVITEIVLFTKEHQTQISTEHYKFFLIFLLNYFYDNANSEYLPEFCDMLFSRGYLTMLPQVQISRNDVSVRKVSTLVLGEMLKVLAEKYLNVDVSAAQHGDSANDIRSGLVDLQYGIEKPQQIATQLQKGQSYSLLIYIYFYCQSSDNPEESTAPLLPYLVEHILKLPKAFVPPPHIIKALWLVFAMSTISNGSFRSLDERVYLEKATHRLVGMLHPDPSIYYTHNPAILLWAFTSQRISNYVRFHVISQWLKQENDFPADLKTQPALWELLLNILIQHKDTVIVENCKAAIHMCMEVGDVVAKQEFAALIWSMLPPVLSNASSEPERGMDSNICYFLELVTTLIPVKVDQTVYLKAAAYVTALFYKNRDYCGEETRHHCDYVCLKLSLYLLILSNKQNDNRVLSTFVNRSGYLPSVLTASESRDERVACVALQLLSCIIHFTNNNYQPETVLEIQTQSVIKSLRRDGTSQRGASLLQLVYTVLNCGIGSPLGLACNIDDTPTETAQCNALRALMFRIQLMCCRNSQDQTVAGWKTLSSVFKHALVAKKDMKLIAMLTSQPWTNGLIQFQMTQNISPEFLTFLLNWLNLLIITINKGQEMKKVQLSKHSVIIKTMVLIKKGLTVEDDLRDLKNKILLTVEKILDEVKIKCC